MSYEKANHSWREELNLCIKGLGLLQCPDSATPNIPCISGIKGYALLPILVVFNRRSEACLEHWPLLFGPFVLEKNMS